MPRTRKPVPVHNLKVTRKGKVKKRSFLWRMRRVFYLAALAVAVLAAGSIYVLGQVELPEDPTVAPVEAQTSFICSSEVQVNCNASNAMASAPSRKPSFTMMALPENATAPKATSSTPPRSSLCGAAGISGTTAST